MGWILLIQFVVLEYKVRLLCTSCECQNQAEKADAILIINISMHGPECPECPRCFAGVICIFPARGAARIVARHGQKLGPKRAKEKSLLFS